MVDTFSPKQCNGCKMCGDLCPVNAISYHTDEKGFWYPVIDHSKCIRCNKCEKICPHVNGCIRYKNPPVVYAAWSKDHEIRMQSTSGGLSYELGKKVINNGGYVVGCSYADCYRKAVHMVAHTLEELEPLMQSKYLQSDTAGIYRKVKKLLDKGNLVMFVGTPCHNAALANYLDKEYDRLIQVEFICRGITSPLAHERYLDYLEDKFHSDIVYFRSKDKRYSWNAFGTAAKFQNGDEYFKNRGFDPKVVSYHRNLTVRPSCEECKCKTPNRVADITLADFWGIEKSSLNPYLEEGTSVVLINSPKAMALFQSLGDSIGFYEKNIEDVAKGNPALYHNLKLSRHWEAFWDDFGKYPFDVLVKKYVSKEDSRVRRILRRLPLIRRNRKEK